MNTTATGAIPPHVLRFVFQQQGQLYVERIVEHHESRLSYLVVRGTWSGDKGATNIRFNLVLPFKAWRKILLQTSARGDTRRAMLKAISDALRLITKATHFELPAHGTDNHGASYDGLIRFWSIPSDIGINLMEIEVVNEVDQGREYGLTMVVLRAEFLTLIISEGIVLRAEFARDIYRGWDIESSVRLEIMSPMSHDEMAIISFVGENWILFMVKPQDIEAILWITNRHNKGAVTPINTEWGDYLASLLA